MKRFLPVLSLAALLGIMITLSDSCKKEDTAVISSGAVSGTVTDENGSPIANVTVSISGMDDSVSTGSEGQFTFPDVPIGKHAVIFKKKGYKTISQTVVAGDFDSSKQAHITISMIAASDKIMGTVTDAKNGKAPLEGATVVLTKQSVFVDSVKTGANGQYEFDGLTADSYGLVFSKEGYPPVTKTVQKDDFTNKTATLDVLMGEIKPLRGLTVEDLKKADNWYFNVYRGGGNAANFPHFDWSVDYMCALSFNGAWEEAWEGTALSIRNDDGQQNAPADLNTFDSYIYGKKKISEGNNILSLRVRTKNASSNDPVSFGVKVVDLSLPQPEAVQIGKTETYGSDDYTDFQFDLSQYDGKEVIIAIGIYRDKTGNENKQLLLRRMAFAPAEVTGLNWLPGTEVIPGWRLTKEMVQSTMVNKSTTFTGISPKEASRDINMQSGYPAAYRSWRGISYVGLEWCLVPLQNADEPTPKEGYLIKTRGNAPVNTQTPESYLYAKLAIAAGHDQLVLKARTFNSNYTYFKLTAIEDDGTVTNVEPTPGAGLDASAAADGCWKFKNNAGDPTQPNSYATFTYDLSQFDNKDVVLVLGVYKGSGNSDENKLAIYRIELK